MNHNNKIVKTIKNKQCMKCFLKIHHQTKKIHNKFNIKNYVLIPYMMKMIKKNVYCKNYNRKLESLFKIKQKMLF